MSSPGDALAQLQAKDKRITELEAERDEAVQARRNLEAAIMTLPDDRILKLRDAEALAQRYSDELDAKCEEAAKAEAEVERLTRERDWWHDQGCSPDYPHPVHNPPGPKDPQGGGILGSATRGLHNAFERAMRKGGGRESDSNTEDMGMTPEQIAELDRRTGRTSANPAALCECGECRRARAVVGAARKERDG